MIGLHGMEDRGSWFVWPIIRIGFRQKIDLLRPGGDMLNNEEGGIKSSFVKKGSPATMVDSICTSGCTEGGDHFQMKVEG